MEQTTPKCPWILEILKVVVIPFTLLFLGWGWKCHLTEKAQEVEVEHQRESALEGMATQLERILPLGQKSIEMRNALTDGCAAGPAAQNREACLAHYLGVLKGLDEFVSGVSWQVDTFPVSWQTYAAFDAVKQRFWRSCDDNQEEDKCGWRQIIVRHVYGISGGPPLLDCRGDNRLEKYNKACHRAITHVRQVVAEALGERVNCFLCELVEEVKDKRRINMQRLARLEEGGEKNSILKQLAHDLSARSEDSQCAKIRKLCQSTDGGIPDTGI